MKPRFSSGQTGFSLIEVMSAIAVLAILGLLLSQITVSISRTTSQSVKAIDAISQARLVFDRLRTDLRGLVKRQDCDFVAQNQSGSGSNNILFFLSEVASSGLSSSQTRGVSLVAYQVDIHPDNKDFQGNPRPGLIRAGKPIPWSSVGTIPAAGFIGFNPSSRLPQTLTYATLPTGLYPTTSDDFDVIGPGVIRMVVGFQLYPDNLSVGLLDGTSTMGKGQVVYSPPIRTMTDLSGNASVYKYVDLSRISSLIIGIVVVDINSLRIADAAQIKTLGSAFATPLNSANQTPVQAWGGIANSVAAMPDSVPIPVRQAVRVYEMAFPITPYLSRGL